MRFWSQLAPRDKAIMAIVAFVATGVAGTVTTLDRVALGEAHRTIEILQAQIASGEDRESSCLDRLFSPQSAVAMVGRAFGHTEVGAVAEE